MKIGLLVLVALLFLSGNAARAQDKSFYIFLSFGQSNMEGFPGIEEQDKGAVNKRFQVLAAVDFPERGRQKGQWYTATPPLARPWTGLGPTDYFGRTMIAHLPPNVRVGVINVSVAGCKIELFDKDHYKSYAETAPSWMKKIIASYGGNPYQRLVDIARLAQRQGVIKGILLHQGESNTNDRAWPGKVKRVYDNLLKDLNLSSRDVPLLAGELVGADQNGACASMNAIIRELPRTIPTSYVISSAGCTARPDRLHFTPAGYRELGKRYGKKMLSLLGYRVAEHAPAPPEITTEPSTTAPKARIRIDRKSASGRERPACMAFGQPVLRTGQRDGIPFCNAAMVMPSGRGNAPMYHLCTRVIATRSKGPTRRRRCRPVVYDRMHCGDLRRRGESVYGWLS